MGDNADCQTTFKVGFTRSQTHLLPDEDPDLTLPDGDPKTFKQAMASKLASEWQECIAEEFNSMIGPYQVFKPVDTMPAAAKLLGCKWVFKTKRDKFGNAVKRKARLVAQGFQQRAGINFHDTFAPVLRFSSLRLLLAIAAAKGYHVIQADIDKAFLYGHLGEEDLYMRVPTGISGFDGKVLKLQRLIYGLKQAGKSWNVHLHSTLLALGFRRLQSDHCIYSKQVGQHWYYIGVYVDDLLFIGPDRAVIDQTLDGLAEKYGVKRLGDADYVLNMQILRLPDGSIGLSQRAYFQSVLKRFNVDNCNFKATPLPAGLSLERSTLPLDPDLRLLYRQIVGSLTYAATGTRPDLQHSVHYLGRFNDCSDHSHLQAAMHCLKHLAGTLNYGLVYSGAGTPMSLQAFSGATWNSDPYTSRSTMGHHVTLGTGSIAWSSRQQSRIAWLSCDVEYLSMNDAGATVISLRETLEELGFPQPAPTPLGCDNNGAYHLSLNPTNHNKNRHIRLQEHLVREFIDSGLLKPHHVAGTQLTADVLTKALPSEPHNRHRSGLGVVDLQEHLSEGGC